VKSELIFLKRHFVRDLHLVKEPFWVALQNLSQLHSNTPCRLPESVHDPAQGGFMNAQHPGQTILTDARGVHPQL